MHRIPSFKSEASKQKNGEVEDLNSNEDWSQGFGKRHLGRSSFGVDDGESSVARSSNPNSTGEKTKANKYSTGNKDARNSSKKHAFKEYQDKSWSSRDNLDSNGISVTSHAYLSGNESATNLRNAHHVKHKEKLRSFSSHSESVNTSSLSQENMIDDKNIQHRLHTRHNWKNHEASRSRKDDMDINILSPPLRSNLRVQSNDLNHESGHDDQIGREETLKLSENQSDNSNGAITSQKWKSKKSGMPSCSNTYRSEVKHNHVPKPQKNNFNHSRTASSSQKIIGEECDISSNKKVKEDKYEGPSRFRQRNPSNESKTQNYSKSNPSGCIEENKKVRIVAETIPEVHFIGELHSFLGLGCGSSVSCQWTLEWGKSWSFLEGHTMGQTQYSFQQDRGPSTWNHPLDFHFACASIQGWPRLQFQIWELDNYGRCIPTGYGFIHLPSSPGYHEISVACWRPAGSMLQELRAFFLGTNTQLVDQTVIFDKSWSNRHRLVTVPAGKMQFKLHVIQRFFHDQCIDRSS